MLIKSRLGSMDCSECRIFRHGNIIFAQRVRQPGKSRFPRAISLPIKIANIPSINLAKEALIRIEYAIENGENIVDLTDLEEN